MPDWAERVEKVKNRLDSRIQRLLHELRQHVKDMGWKVSGITDMSDEQFSWSFIVHVEDPTQGIDQWCDSCMDVKFEISESIVHEGTEDGVNFRLEFTGNGGITYGAVAPFNYTDQCWVTLEDDDAINTRLALVEQEARDALEMCLDDHLKKTADKGFETMQHNPHQTIDFKLAVRLRERGLALPIGANYADERLQEIAEEQHRLMQEHEKLDEKLKRVARGGLE